MVYVPDSAILDGHKLSPAANRLYGYYCIKRNKQTGGWPCPNKAAAEALKLSRSRMSEARRELASKGWIAEGEKDFIRPLYGFSAVENSTGPVEISTASVEISTGRLDKDRARGSDQPTNQTLEAQPPASPPGGGGAGAARSDHRDGMRYLHERCGPIPDPGAQGAFVFSVRGRLPHRATLDRQFRAAVSVAKIEDFHFHDLRHTAATRMLDAGVRESVIARVLGHSSTAMTVTYAHVTDELTKGAAEAISGGNGHNLVTGDFGKGRKTA